MVSVKLKKQDASKSLGSKGFTLIEILAATSIMVAIILMVLYLTNGILTSWTRASGQLSSNFEGRIALDLVTQDLQSAVFRNDNKVWLQVEYEEVDVPGAVDLQNQAELMFFSPAADRPYKKFENGNWVDIEGSECAIRYKVNYKNPWEGEYDNSGIRLFGLYRSVIDAESTFNTARAWSAIDETDNYLDSFWDGDVPGGDNGASASEAEAIDDQGEVVSGSGFVDWVDGSSNFLSAHVVDFRVVFYYRDEAGEIVAITDDELPTGDPLPFHYWNGLNIEGVPVAGELVYADVNLTIISDQGARVLQGKIDQGLSVGTEDFEALLDEYSNNFSRRVYLYSRSI